jgi:regulator of protease activity HflC (stomatin/prohibitin superfamily)
MTEDELNAIVESKLADRLAARLQADRERVRADVTAELRREAERKHYDRINARHPIEGLGDPKVEAARCAAMDARARADNEHMDRVNSRPVEGSLTRQRSRAALVPGSEGFRFKG